MPNPYITKNSKIPISGPKAYIDGGEKGYGKSVLPPSPALQITPNNYQIGRLQGVRSDGSSYGTAPTPPSVREEIKQRVDTAAQNTQSSPGGYTYGGYAPGGYTEKESYSTEIPETMSYEDYFKKVGGDVYESDVRKAIDARVQQAVNAYERQKQQAETSYKNAARQTYVNNMMSQRNMEQQLAASGVYGGMADSQRIAMDANYQNEVADLEQQYIDTLADLEQAITDARLAGDTQAAEQMAGYKANVQSQYASYLMQKDQQAASIAQWQRERSAAGRTSSGGGGYYGGYDNGSLSPEQVAEMQGALGVTADGKWGSGSSTAANGMSADEAWQAYQAAKSKTGGYGGGGGVNTMMTK